LVKCRWPIDLATAGEGTMMRFAMGRKMEVIEGDWVRGLGERLARRSIVLVGMPGSGKSAVGRRLAARLQLSFVDADEEIERAAGKPIMDIFKDHGEAHFRDGERKVIARLLNSGPQVLATGGGAFMVAETRNNVRRLGISVWIKAELQLLVRRVLKRNTRPLLQVDPEGVMRALMQTRYPIYATADVTVESRDLPHDAIVAEIIEALAKGPLAGAQGPATQPSLGSSS
jgi:shikimate kinase